MHHNILKNTMVEMTWPEIESLAKENALVLLPVGVIEEHGRHLPLGTDIYIAAMQTEEIAEELASLGMKCVIAPPFYWGAMSVVTKNFPGSFNMRSETIQMLLHDILQSLEDAGFKKVVAINAHGDPAHRVAITEAFKTYNKAHQLNARWLTFEDEMQWEGFKGNEDYILAAKPYPFEKLFTMTQPPKDEFDVHAGAFETAMMHHLFPELTDMACAKTLNPTMLKGEAIKRWQSGKAQDNVIIPDGHAGDPADSQYITANMRDANKAVAQDIYDFYK